jgi:hypothetical protein
VATQQLLAEAVRDSQTFGPFALGAAAPKQVILTVTSSVWIEDGHAITIVVERSLDAGASWRQMGAVDGVSNHVGKSGGVENPALGMSWDGLACQVRVTVTVNAPFAWGATLTS